jgi:hypothetical protein
MTEDSEHPTLEAAANTSTGLTDADLRGAMLGSLRLLAVLAAVVTAVFWWKLGWQSGALVLIGAGISGASLWEWLRLITLFNETMDKGKARRPMGLTLAGFFLRVGLTIAVLYVSLKFLNGTAFGLAIGLGLGILSLTIEALRLLNRWTQ